MKYLQTAAAIRSGAEHLHLPGPHNISEFLNDISLVVPRHHHPRRRRIPAPSNHAMSSYAVPYGRGEK